MNFPENFQGKFKAEKNAYLKSSAAANPSISEANESKTF